MQNRQSVAEEEWDATDVEEEYQAELSSLIESLRRVRYWIAQGGHGVDGEEEEPGLADGAIPANVWALCWEYAEPVLEVAEHHPLEASLLAILCDTCEQLVEAVNHAEPERRALSLDALPQDVYKRWNVACLVLMALWDSKDSPEYVPQDLIRVLQEDPEALARIGLSGADMPPSLRIILE